ncbi:ABC transporter ATP-binding protein [Sporomusa termitida]|uniref:Putative ABC transporter ATP-binding protein YknY n=1 Tax=Sporomusa termitida TaxID=2377 RepID=A0A517DRA1_9FIRM|nr:ABC transporter ATP-binding protein [Sporomusa termitida]QDR79894.1 putative ABC transporter ATP-binding protein YknY [Sporomusa termitida]
MDTWFSRLMAAPLPPPRPGAAAVALAGVHKVFVTGAGEFTALQEVNLQVAPGEFVAVVGKSGSGKSTLINMITGIDRPSGGEVWVAGTPVHTLTENQTAVWRGRTLGVVFQFFQLLPTLTALENVMLPMDFCHVYEKSARPERALALLELVGVSAQAGKLPATLSGGQQQRVAIARSLANDPPLLVADEPTGNLDSRTAAAVLALFQGLARAGKTIVMVTHDQDIARQSSRIITVAEGRVVPVGEGGGPA